MELSTAQRKYDDKQVKLQMLECEIKNKCWKNLASIKSSQGCVFWVRLILRTVERVVFFAVFVAETLEEVSYKSKDQIEIG